MCSEIIVSKFIKQLKLNQLHVKKFTGNLLTICGNNKTLNILILPNNLSSSLIKYDLSFNYNQIELYTNKCIYIIQSKIGLNKVIYARNCEFKRINKLQADVFLNKYHLLNSVSNGIYFSLQNNDKIIAVAAFSKGRKLNTLKTNERSYELLRFCCINGVTIAGGLSKLITNFVKVKNASHIMTYTDNMFGENLSLKKIGFTKEELFTPKIPLNKNQNTILNKKIEPTYKNTKWVKYYSTQLL